VASADAQLKHHGSVAGFREGEPFFDGVDDGGQIGPRIKQPHLGLHGEGVGAFLHDAGTFAVVFTDDDQSAANDARGGEVGQRVGGHVGTDGGFESNSAAKRVVNGSGHGRGGGGFGGAVLEMHTKLFENVVGIGENIHQMGNRRALIARDVGNTRLK